MPKRMIFKALYCLREGACSTVTSGLYVPCYTLRSTFPVVYVCKSVTVYYCVKLPVCPIGA